MIVTDAVLPGLGRVERQSAKASHLHVIGIVDAVVPISTSRIIFEAATNYKPSVIPDSSCVHAYAKKSVLNFLNTAGKQSSIMLFEKFVCCFGI